MITISWWWFPVGLVALAFIVPAIWPGFRLRGDYDMVTPLVCAAIFIGFIGMAVAVCIGYWLAK